MPNRHAKSTGDLLSLLTGHLRLVLEKRGEAFVVAMDISKAFDQIWHKGLLHKLKSYGITGPYHAIISDFLTNHQIKVVLDGQSSCLFNEFRSSTRIYFGSYSFHLFINDLPDALQSQVALYADDSTLFCSSLGRRDASHTELCSMLDRDLAQVLAWGQVCRYACWLPVSCLEIHPSQCSCIYTRLPFDHLLGTLRTFGQAPQIVIFGC